MIKFLRGLGMTSDVAYLAGMLSIGASIAAWTASTRMEDTPGDKADRWGIYVGLWAPTFMALGNAIKLDEGQLSIIGSTPAAPLPVCGVLPARPVPAWA